MDEQTGGMSRRAAIAAVGGTAAVTASWMAGGVAKLRAEAVKTSGPRAATVWTVRVTNKGRGAANDVRLTGVAGPGRWGAGRPVPVSGRDPGRFPVPVAAAIAPGACATFQVTADLTGSAGVDPHSPVIEVSANGGRATATAVTGRAGR